MGIRNFIHPWSKARTGFLQLAYRILEPTLEKLGWASVPDEGNLQFSRSAVIQRLGSLGFAATCGEASLLWMREERGKDDIRLDIRAAVYRTVARNGGQKEFAAFRCNINI